MESILLDQLSVLSHPGRMAVFRLLQRRFPQAVAAGDIAAALDLKASTASVYLSALTRAGLIAQERRGASLRYRLELEETRRMVSGLFNDCCGGRPDLCPPDFHVETARVRDVSNRKYNVLFICTGNSARSIFAEAIMRHEAGDRFNAYSAGTKPRSELNPFAIAMLKAKGIPTEDLRAKNIAEFQGPDAPALDFVFTVCDLAANEECPAWSGQPISAHWGLPDPVKAIGTEAERRLAFQQTFGAMHNRIRAFAALPIASLDRASLQARVDDIGRAEETV